MQNGKALAAHSAFLNMGMPTMNFADDFTSYFDNNFLVQACGQTYNFRYYAASLRQCNTLGTSISGMPDV